MPDLSAFEVSFSQWGSIIIIIITIEIVHEVHS